MAQSPVPTDKLMSGPKIFRNQTIFLKTYGLKYGPGTVKVAPALMTPP